MRLVRSIGLRDSLVKSQQLTQTSFVRYVFSKCYREDARAAALLKDDSFMAHVEELKAGVLNPVEHFWPCF